MSLPVSTPPEWSASALPMNRSVGARGSTPRCLAASALGHAALLGIVLFAPAFRSAPPETVEVQLLEVIPSKLVDSSMLGGGGGNPTSPSPKPVDVSPPTPTPTVETPKPIQPNPTPAVPKPPAAIPEVPKPKAAENPVAVKPEPVKPEAILPKPEPVTKAKPTKEIEVSEELVKANPKSKPDPKADSKAEKKRQEQERASKAQAEREEREQAQREARERFETAMIARERALKGAMGRISQGLSGSTEIKMPGPGAAAYAPYGAYLKTFYYERWRRPSSMSGGAVAVGVSITVSKDGTLLEHSIVEPSGNRAIDDSVREVLGRYRKLQPLPEGVRDTQRVFLIQFRLQPDSPA